PGQASMTTTTTSTAEPGTTAAVTPPSWPRARRAVWPATTVAAVLAAVALPALFNAYLVSIAATAIVLATLALSTQLLAGVAGLPSLGQAAYLAVGAYTAAILATDTGITNAP